MASPTNRLLDNLKVDVKMSPDLENLLKNNSQIGPNATKLGLRAITKEGSKQIKSRIDSLGLVDSGRLRKSIKGVTNKNKSFIGTKLFYAPFLESGTKQHTVRPKKKKDMFWNGIFAKMVHNPGTKGYHFFDDTWQSMESSGQVQSLFAQGVNKALEDFENGRS